MKHQKPKTAANSIRNRAKVKARHTAVRRERQQNQGMLGCVALPVLDLLNLGGPSKVHVKAQAKPKCFGTDKVPFHNGIGQAFRVANL